MNNINFKSNVNYLVTEYERDSAPIFMLADAFLSISSMTNKKLQKLCYYAKAWYLAIYDENIIPENFEAWVHGAVQPDLYQAYKIYGFNYIPKLDEKIKRDIPEEYISFAQRIYDSYGHLSGDELESINHSETPWKNARKNIPSWMNSSNIISEEDMKVYYRALQNNE